MKQSLRNHLLDVLSALKIARRRNLPTPRPTPTPELVHSLRSKYPLDGALQALMADRQREREL
jgi:hypothetical protein